MGILEILVGRFPSGLILILTIFSGVLPYIAYITNKKLHQHGDPPWKEKDFYTEQLEKNPLE